MAPKKTPGAGAAAKENVTLGPLAGDGAYRAFSHCESQQLTKHRQARFRCCPHFRLFQRHLRPRHRSEVRATMNIGYGMAC